MNDELILTTDIFRSSKTEFSNEPRQRGMGQLNSQQNSSIIIIYVLFASVASVA